MIPETNQELKLVPFLLTQRWLYKDKVIIEWNQQPDGFTYWEAHSQTTDDNNPDNFITVEYETLAELIQEVDICLTNIQNWKEKNNHE